MGAVFRDDGDRKVGRSDRAARDRQRHRAKLRRSLKDNIADIISEESIIGRSGDQVVKVPIRGVKEYRFKYGDDQGGVASGDGGSKKGQVVGRNRQGSENGAGRADDSPGADIYETEISIDELVEIMFEDLELPSMERKALREIVAERDTKRRGYRVRGPRVHLDRRRTVRARIKRKVARSGGASVALDAERLPFRQEDLVYRRMAPEQREESNAAVFCIMDTSGSMDRLKKYLARSFFFLLYQFIAVRYNRVDVVFVAHHSEAKEVDEDTFFHRGESGGTVISSAYKKTAEIIADRYHPDHWNNYAFHCSDGDNFESDNEAALAAAKKLCEHCVLFGYGEIKPLGAHYYESSMLSKFKTLGAKNFQSVLIERREDVWPAFRAFFAKEKVVS